MKKIYRLLTCVILPVILSCIQEDFRDGYHEVDLTARMEMEPETRTTLSGLDGGKYYPLWSKGDKIAVYVDGNAEYESFFLTSGEGTVAATFSGNKKGGSYVALYPDEIAATMSKNTVSLVLPNTQEYSENSFGQGSFPMIANGGSDGNLKFMNLCSVLKISMTGKGTIRSITVKSNNKSVYLSGPATVRTDYSDVPELVMSDNGLNSIKLECGGVELSKTSCFYMVVPAQKYIGGLTIEIDAYTEKVIKIIESDLVFERSQIREVKGLTLESETYEAVHIPDNEIWYESATGDVLSIDSNTDFGGASVVSNTYEDGRGIIRFDGNVTSIAGPYRYDERRESMPTGYIFNEPSQLLKIGLPKTIKMIHGRAFALADNLTEFWGELCSKDGRCIILDGVVTSFARSGIDEYSIPSGVKAIGPYAFAYLQTLKTLIISEGVENIMSNAFDSSAIEYIYIPSSINQLNASSFRRTKFKRFFGTSKDISDDGCAFGFAKNITVYASGSGQFEYAIPDGVESISDHAFYKADELRVINFPDSFKEATGLCFEETGQIEQISGRNVLNDNRSLVIDNKLMFVAAGGLDRYVTPKSVWMLAEGVFNFKDSLKEIVITDQVLKADYGNMFQGNTALETVTLSAKLDDLGLNPFMNYSWATPNLKTVYCRAPVPPLVWCTFPDDAYRFDDLTVYVPEESLSLYLESDDWADYRDYIKPYKFNYDGADEDNPDFYVSSDYSADGTVVTLQKASEGSGINIVLMGDGYSDRLIADGTYGADMEFAYHALFTEEPYKSFQHLFNVSYVNVVSATEVFDYGMTALKGYFGYGSKVGGDESLCKEYAMKAVDKDEIKETSIVVLLNSERYAGTCTLFSPSIESDYGSGTSFAFCSQGGSKERFASTIYHEVCGHGFGKLADEYYEIGSTVGSSIIERHQQEMGYGWWKNIAFTSDPSQVKWSKFLNDERYAYDGLGVFEGGLGSYQFGVWRPTLNSIMCHNTGGFNAPSREAIYYRIHKLAYGGSWEYDYEKFVEYDAINRKSSEDAISASRLNYVERTFEPLHPPVIIPHSMCED